MNIKKTKLIAFLTFIICMCLLIYHLQKPYNYSIEIKAKTSAANQYLRATEAMTYLKNKTNDSIELIKNHNYKELEYQLKKPSDSIYTVNWNFKSLNDSISLAKITVKNTAHFYKIKFQSLFKSPSIQFELSKLKNNYVDFLKAFLDKTNVKIIGIDELPENNYCYIKTQSNVSDKAKLMMKYNNPIVYWMNENNHKISGQPAVEVTNWDIENDRIEFNFLFPFKKTENLEIASDSLIKIKTIPKRKALKAIYHGNYLNSHIAWFQVIEYAKNHNIKIELKPIELFFNNPNQGINEKEWKAEIYFPIIEN